MTYQWITLENGQSVYRKVKAPTDNARSDLPVPMVIRDEMPDTEHPCTGQSYSSKSAFRAVTKAHGCIEVGNDSSRFNTPEKPKVDRKEIRASLEKAKAKLNA
ncbi:hypothetical protein [Ochrobactrum sp. SFR4]|uniref:hypothetical protein n=1 Tax=Ochrobactrum sp. SFR4 TaxID=2717368 RepID=UPI001C8C2525|nr:hypothetical protein [Ochrobactrum sp. SFR4]MBX8825255.1 hypothetical protein [Ochrobactrum sp. SFR4]